MVYQVYISDMNYPTEIVEIGLDQEQKQKLESNWKVLEDYRWEQNIDAITPRYELYKLGRPVLPFLEKAIEDRFNEHASFEASYLFQALAEEDDLGLVEKLLRNKDVLSNPDGSAVSNLQKILATILKEIREKDPDDPRLHQAAKLMIDTYDLHGNEYKKYRAISVLALTGTEEARRFIEEKQMMTYDNVQMLADAKRVPLYLIGREPIPKPDTTLQHTFLDDELESQIQVWDLGGRVNLDPDETLDIEEINRIAAEAKMAVFRMDNVEETVKGELLLYAYNFLTTHENITDADREWLANRLNRINVIEKRYRDGAILLPTVGNELEMQPVFDRARHRKILESLGISLMNEQDDLLEVNHGYSYSPSTQSRLLEELTKLGAIDLEENENGSLIISPENVLSLHLNFGIPQEIETVIESTGGTDIDVLVDGLVYAFVSPHRLRVRKSSGFSYSIKTTNVSRTEKSGGRRLEIKITEFKNFPTFRLNQESQELVGAMFADMKRANGVELSEKEVVMADLWQEFKKEVVDLRLKYDIPAALYNKSKEKAAKVAENENLRNDMRQVVDTYSRKIREIVFGKLE
ncbi:hypothetical protein A3K29_05805 [Candidatus Collierbacteria bacterium RIFOXYB2_FULL_46_14]|nr:MAG: hypothetical protein A3K29_05805 [Candidatus Collierbacteria bacterium RIFOXYB2_FULL_46_14]OGD76646.1 MAG: hypothetical protein A3K43_05805 [Candidatus Collierbacteria bacterium RIFOXYA2_FULL_46_20]OGD77982.1 MAG: hypothetical protein A3K39_05805 [Candidatus Collierbacteria bacterium RIFOXYC2_FULL_43_15]OGD80006.1 MAG: hypothetical protein A2320_00235 [Pseudomonadales bacterium GWC2_63_15]OGD82704.1 MAG: hypothetical protein A3K36_05805 [Candidatus Collierbacteria bacterium RIFOXYD2_FUL